jgi:hypothetical protein
MVRKPCDIGDLPARANADADSPRLDRYARTYFLPLLVLYISDAVISMHG